jgi:hypothetical protein
VPGRVAIGTAAGVPSRAPPPSDERRARDLVDHATALAHEHRSAGVEQYARAVVDGAN